MDNIKEWLQLFNKCEMDIAMNNTGETQRPYSDIDYYTEQIHNLTDEEDWDNARNIALAMYEYTLKK